jgi:hypothetical protein
VVAGVGRAIDPAAQQRIRPVAADVLELHPSRVLINQLLSPAARSPSTSACCHAWAVFFGPSIAIGNAGANL